MNKRFLWNFEINAKPKLLLPISAASTTDLRWEVRYFWPEEAIILLHGLDARFLQLHQYKIEHKQDYYYIAHNLTHNLKIRDNKTYYKELVQQEDACWAYKKKVLVVLEDMVPQLDGKYIQVDKETLKYNFLTQPKTRLEFSRLCINNQIYFSVCVESYAKEFVTQISQHIVKNTVPCDYVTFLQSIAL